MKNHWKLLLVPAAASLCLLADAPPDGLAAPGEGGRAAFICLSPGGMCLKLGEGEEPVVPSPPARTEKLTEAEARVVLDRLPPMEPDSKDEKAFAFRERSLPPPRPGETATTPFPPPAGHAAPERPASGPLEVLRWSPEGEVPIARHLSITFSQPMVPVTSVAELTARSVPVKLTPTPPGKWRWVGTRTLLFEPEERLAMATGYTVEIPAGVRSESGGQLAETKTFRFTTPVPRVVRSYPSAGDSDGIDLNPVFFLEFDQAVIREGTLAVTRVTCKGRDFPLRVAADEELNEDFHARSAASKAQKGRWIALRPVNALPKASTCDLATGPAVPSAEGPLVRKLGSEVFRFETYHPLKVAAHECGWDPCSPGAPLTIEFNNSIDLDAFKDSMVKVVPEIPGLKVDLSDTTITIEGRTRGRTRYAVTVAAGITDSFGQTLGRDVTVSFNVGRAAKRLLQVGDDFVVLDPASGPRYSVLAVNHPSVKVRAYAVTPEDWPAWHAYLDGTRNNPPGRLAISGSFPVRARPDEFVEVPIDLSRALKDGLGQVALVVEPPTRGHPDEEPERVTAWVQATRIGLYAAVDGEAVLGWATDLAGGRPIQDAELALAPGGVTSTTDVHGLARLPIPAGKSAQRMLVARSGGDVAFLPESTWGHGDRSSWVRAEPKDSILWYAFDDRKMYRPNEKVRVKGWVRRLSGASGGVLSLPPAGMRLKWTAADARGAELKSGEVGIGALGGYDLAFDLPDAVNLGRGRLHLSASDATGSLTGTHTHDFQVEEFRRPEFEVTARASEGPHFAGGTAFAAVNASYYAGGGLPDAEVQWTVSWMPAGFTPPNRDEFEFGPNDSTGVWRRYGGGRRVERLQGRTDASGTHRLKVELQGITPQRPMTVRAEAGVTDVNRQQWSAAASFLVHPAELYVGLRSPRAFIEQGEKMPIEAIVVDLDGRAVAGRRVDVTAVRLEWTRGRDSEWTLEEKDDQDCAFLSGEAAHGCVFEPKAGGEWRIAAGVVDAKGRVNRTTLSVWVSGGEPKPPEEVEEEKVTLVPDRKEYRPGDTASILVQTPFQPAEGVLTVRRQGVVHSVGFTMRGPTQAVSFPVLDSYLPGVHVDVQVAGAGLRANDLGLPDEKLPRRPAFASGEVFIPVPALSRKLAVNATPAATRTEPGVETSVSVEVRDSLGKPVANAEVALVVVDEAVLALSGFKLTDPLDTFWFRRTEGVSDHHLRRSVLLLRWDQIRDEMEASAYQPPEPSDGRGVLKIMGFGSGGGVGSMDNGKMPVRAFKAKMGAKGGGGHHAPEHAPIRARVDFEALAVFAPAVSTDATGRATVPFKLPDNLTRYRVMAVAVAGDTQFGLGESAITARLPLMVRPSAPRFLNFGDRFGLPVVVQNQTDKPMAVDVVARAVNAVLTEGRGLRVTVPANDRAEVRFPVASAMAGTARFQVGAASGRWSDAASVKLPVWTPVTTEAFATYGQIDEGAMAQPVLAPPGIIKEYGGLEISTSSTALQALTDAVLYLTSYPFECSEQISSRILAVAALKDVLGAFKAEGLPAPKELASGVTAAIQRLKGRQNSDGGFGLWTRDRESWPFVSVHAAHALVRAGQKGFEVPAEMLDRAKSYLRGIKNRIPAWYPEQVRRTLTAYALHVRDLTGDRDQAGAVALFRSAGLDGLTPEAMGWLLSTLDAGCRGACETRPFEVQAILRHLGNRVEETAGAAHFVTSYSDGAHLLMHSDRRADAVLLDALIAVDPGSDLIPKVVAGLLAHRKKGRWSNTQENVFVLLALDRYFQEFEKKTPDFVARMWLGERYAGDHEYRGRTTERWGVDIPMAEVARTNAAMDLVLAKEGPGRMYYRIGMRYAPSDLALGPFDAGFTIQRTYEAADDPGDVRRDKDGTWRMKAGSRVRVRLTMVAHARRYHVALADPIPAGLEALNPALKVTGAIPTDTRDPRAREGFWWWRGTWYEHQNMRDERVEAFASLLWDGVHSYSYVARATTPGRFIAPPAKAEEMYAPETFGRSGTDVVIVE